jgi:hypothetical protein
MLNDSINRRHFAVFCLFCIYGAAILSYILYHDLNYAHDDAFISFKYARNLAEGNGLVFNKGERVWGYTSPANTILLGTLTALGLDTHQSSVGLGIIFIALSAFLLYMILCGFFHPAVSFLIPLHLMSNGVNNYLFLSLETNLLIFSQLLFLFTIQKEKYRTACSLAALSCLIRPDAILLVLPIMLLHRECRRLNHIIYFIIPGALWMLFTLFYYGTVLPNTFYAKRQHTAPVQYFHVQFYKIFTLQKMLPFLSSKNWIAAISITFSLCSLLTLSYRKHKALIFSFVIYPWLIFIGYGLIGAPPRHNWEVFSARCFFWLSALIGLAAFFHFLFERLLRINLKRTAIVFSVAMCLFYLVFFIIPDGSHLFTFLDRQSAGYYRGELHDAYHNVARWVNEHLYCDKSLALREVGTVGYYTDHRLIDLSGIITKIRKNGKK